MPITEPGYLAVSSPGGSKLSLVGGTIASAATVAPVAFMTYITGTAEIVNITLPYPAFSGKIVLLPEGAFTWTAAGNIAVLGTATADRALVLFYNAATTKWYPSYVA
jgi:hypothetical protein